MTKAICWRCGEYKSGSFVPCPKCNADPTTEDERIISLFLTDHYQDETSLNALHVQISNGGRETEQYVIPDDVKEQIRPALAAVSTVLGNGSGNNISTQKRLKDNQPSSNIFLSKIVPILLVVFVPTFCSIFAWSIYGNSVLFLNKIVPFEEIFGQSFPFAIDFIGGIIFSYVMFWTAFKVGPKKHLKGILIPISVFILDSYLPQIRISILELENITYFYAAFAGSMLVVYASWTGRFKFLIPPEIRRRSSNYEKLNNKENHKNLEKDHDETSELERVAKYKLDNKNYKGAIADYKKLIEKEEDPIIKSYQLGCIANAYESLGEDDKSFEYLTKSYKMCTANKNIAKKYFQVMEQRGLISYNEKNKSMKDNFDSEITKRERKTAAELIRRSIYKLEKGLYESAQEDAENGLALDPRQVSANFVIGMSKTKKQEYKGGLEALNKAINADIALPHSDIYLSRGICKQGLNDIEGARDDWAKALELEPEKSELIFFRGFGNFLMEDYGNALNDFERIIEVFPERVDLLHAYSVCISKAGEYETAIKYLKKLLELDPDNKAYTYQTIGKNYINLENYDEALDYLEKSRELDPTDKETMTFFNYARKKNLKEWEEEKSNREED